MKGALDSSARLLFRSALVIFLVTIVIGILNGLDIWLPDRQMILTHVHAGTLGWITMSVVGVALLMYGANADEKAVASGTRLAQAVVGATVLYVIAFASTTGIFRPIAGTLMLAAIVWALIWVIGRRASTPPTIPSVGMLLALISLTIGAVLGVLLGLFIANGSLPGLDADTAGSLAGAHPPAMLIGYLVLAGVAISEWLLDKSPKPASESKSGLTVVYGLFLSGLLFNVAFIADIEALIQVASMLEVIGVVIFLVRMRNHLKPSAWKGIGSDAFGIMSVVYVAVGIALLVYVVQLFVSGELDPETGEGPVGVLIAFDHALFIGAMTNALFGVVARRVAYDGLVRMVVWGVNVGLAGFLVGLVVDSAVIKRISTPVMGLALIIGIYVFLTRSEVLEASSA